MGMTRIFFTLIFLLPAAECNKTMIPHGLLRNYWEDGFFSSDNHVFKLSKYPYSKYSLVFKSNNNQLLSKFEPNCLHSCEDPLRSCYVIFTAASEPKGSLQICQDDLVNLSMNTTLPLNFISTTSGKHVIINEAERTRNESTWIFTKIYPMYTLASLEMQPFQAKITDTNNTKAVAFINYERPTYPFDNYAYEVTVVNETQYSSYEFGLLLTIGLVIDELRIYPNTADEQY